VVVVTAALLPAVASHAKIYPGVAPKPLFSTPGRAAYCYVSSTSYEDDGAEVECWRPRDGFFITMPWRARRGRTAFMTKPPGFVHGTRVLKGFRPQAPVLGFGQRWSWRCRDPADFRTCSPAAGRLTFTCTSGRGGLTCTNVRKHGFWLGRFHGYRFF
jgi:hypothetical protein